MALLAIVLMSCSPTQEAAITPIVQEVEVPVTVLAEVTREVEVVQTVEVVQEVEVTVLVEQEVTKVVEVFPPEMLPALLVGGSWEVFAFFDDQSYVIMNLLGEQEFLERGTWDTNGDVISLDPVSGPCVGIVAKYQIEVVRFDIINWHLVSDSCADRIDVDGVETGRFNLPDWVEPLLAELE